MLKEPPILRQIDAKFLERITRFQNLPEKVEIYFQCTNNWVSLTLFPIFKFPAQAPPFWVL